MRGIVPIAKDNYSYSFSYAIQLLVFQYDWSLLWDLAENSEDAIVLMSVSLLLALESAGFLGDDNGGRGYTRRGLSVYS